MCNIFEKKEDYLIFMEEMNSIKKKIGEREKIEIDDVFFLMEK